MRSTTRLTGAADAETNTRLLRPFGINNMMFPDGIQRYILGRQEHVQLKHEGVVDFSSIFRSDF